MSQDGVNKGRRTLLLGATTAVGAVGAGFVAVPFVKSWVPSERAKAAGAPAKIDISKIEPGAMLTAEWRGKPVYVARRTQEMLDNLPGLADRLKDPENTVKTQQPAYADNINRSIKPELIVLLGVCTHLGCAPKYNAEVKPEPFDPNWKGGWFCPCHGSRFDLSGRVFKGSPAAINLEVPPYMYESDSVIVVGVDEEKA
ncbi:MAG: ubiquinol-cytochrome c reductase iron-sulfur subunit [Oceanospirillaceae bacterium]|uniref:ubiquinol-cytochrome c reductase iron-sulfur subunit n=1 Tax=unclassified Thalassolituus TaxID=2624967 RepID=UPI000C629B3C|nr:MULTISPECIES: ubiquinol-cytochrome c reductase iron-sulfur subunit [unclassified Thalassolituus]MAS24736.1 ubiquinol-cytochrome c reductase iron-sulfur subunit [Oceanospirillaceae bacterium]MAY00756.1 ubiquinol-cytochrome c reductase iron-sulfur subunit [Oceanospirillaceae bacterium]MBS54553.1 ubiquinol-cytochrome c reductase iron-sulfur subunit [Oceanospirillaceae bacterium]